MSPTRLVAALLIAGALLAACGAGDPASFYATGADLAARLDWPCGTLEVVEDPPPGEHHLTCVVEGRRVGGGVLFPDESYRSDPDAVLAQFNQAAQEMPEELCEHYGGGPVLAGANWWLVAEDDDWLQTATADVGGRLSASVDCPSGS